MAEENDHGMAEVTNLLEAEPFSSPARVVAPLFAEQVLDIPALREQLAIMVSTNKTKEAIDVQLTHEQGTRLAYAEEHHKRFETYVGAKFTQTLIESLLALSTKELGMVVKLRMSSKRGYIITKELSAWWGGLRCDESGCSPLSTRR